MDTIQDATRCYGYLLSTRYLMLDCKGSADIVRGILLSNDTARSSLRSIFSGVR